MSGLFDVYQLPVAYPLTNLEVLFHFPSLDWTALSYLLNWFAYYFRLMRKYQVYLSSWDNSKRWCLRCRRSWHISGSYRLSSDVIRFVSHGNQSRLFAFFFVKKNYKRRYIIRFLALWCWWSCLSKFHDPWLLIYRCHPLVKLKDCPKLR